MVKIIGLNEVNEQYVKARFAVDFDKEDLKKLDRLIIGFWTMSTKENRQWINPPSMKDRQEDIFKPVMWTGTENMNHIKDEIKEALKGILKQEDTPVKEEEIPFF